MKRTWEQVKLTEICSPKQWRTISMNNLKKSGYPVYGANGKIGFYNDYNHEQPTILITCRGATCGTINICEPFSYVTGNAMSLDNLNENRVNLKYLYYCLGNFGLQNIITGTAQPQITRQSLDYVSLPLPSLQEQKRIAAILDKADAIRRKRQQAIQLADEFLRSVFLDMFGDPVTNPKGWEVKSLGENLDFLTSGSRGWAKYYSNEGEKFLRIQNIGKNKLFKNDMAFVKPPNSAEAKRTKVKSGDILISITADLGRTAVVPDNFGTAYINQHLAIIRVKNLNSIYLSEYLASQGGQVQIQKLNRQGVKAGLNFDDIKSLKILIPPLDLQKKYEQIWLNRYKFKENYDQLTKKSGEIFNSLTQRAFRGEL
ncbi:Type-I restriction modification system methylase [Desulfonema limicola]|uniref:Type-I restriction modification system methylase n=1 Tax=Desulfonema limicola TaxID=45656 RepID=A0A975B7U1_9BACT|nr:restriction endonuclease subunit S [Desulfonema limicola]QTA80482.1 Type-I restriction modification system methylase [Desulfonema limicola]